MSKISIICPSFNHGRFVGSFIRSVLSQTMNEWELIIVDDNSTDNNVDEIMSFNDPRIKLIRHSWNMGINAGLMEGISEAKGDYIVFCASDDMLHPRHLKTVSEILDTKKSVGAVACLVTSVNEDDAPSDYLRGFVPYTQDRYAALRYMFLNGNCMLSPGMTVRKSLLESFFPLAYTDVMVQDYAMWVKILSRANVEWTAVPLVYYRRMSDGANVSARNATYNLRCKWEASQLLDAYLDLTEDVVSVVFSDELSRLGLNVYAETLPYVLGRIALTSAAIERKEWGYRTIVNFAKIKEKYELLHRLHGFDYKMLLSLVPDDASSLGFSHGHGGPRPTGLAKIFYKAYRHFYKREIEKTKGL